MDWLSGKKTYIIGAAMFIVAGLHAIRAQIPALASIPDETWQEIMKDLQVGGTGLIAIFLRLGMGKLLK
jgi:hypothetical protein